MTAEEKAEEKLLADCRRLADPEDPPPEWLNDGQDLARIEAWLRRQYDRQVLRCEAIREELATTMLQAIRKIGP